MSCIHIQSMFLSKISGHLFYNFTKSVLLNKFLYVNLVIIIYPVDIFVLCAGDATSLWRRSSTSAASVQSGSPTSPSSTSTSGSTPGRSPSSALTAASALAHSPHSSNTTGISAQTAVSAGHSPHSSNTTGTVSVHRLLPVLWVTVLTHQTQQVSVHRLLPVLWLTVLTHQTQQVSVHQLT